MERAAAVYLCENCLLSPLFRLKNEALYQDRLGTSIGTALKKETRCLTRLKKKIAKEESSESGETHTHTHKRRHFFKMMFCFVEHAHLPR